MLLYFFIALFVKLITIIISFSSPDNQFNNVKKSAIQSLIIITAQILLSFLYVLVIDNFLRKISGLLDLQKKLFIEVIFRQD